MRGLGVWVGLVGLRIAVLVVLELWGVGAGGRVGVRVRERVKMEVDVGGGR